jgi:proteasome lid subunit RPN8/RPN11
MNNRIQFGEPIHPEVPEEELPPDFLLTGSVQKWEAATFRVYMMQEVYAEIWAHVSKTPDIESGGVLVGHPFRTFNDQTTFVIITAAIPQHSQDRSGGHFTVGPVQIAEARREMEQRYPGLIAVGWYHSHPGHGVFLSGQDMTIVSSIYDAPWHIALVIDPQRRKEGVFVGPEGRQIGGRGDRPREVSWIGLRAEPDSVKAIALYNQVHNWLGEKHLEAARDALSRLYSLVESSSQLRYWQDRGEYRDLTKLRFEMDDLPPQQFLSADEQIAPRQTELNETTNTPPLHTSPEPARRRKNWSSIHWLTLSALSAIGFAVFTLFAALMIETWPYWLTLGWGILLSFLAVILAGFVIFSRQDIESVSSNLSGIVSGPLHSAGERIMAFFLVGLVLILWVSYGVFSVRMMTSGGSPISPEPPTLIVSQTPATAIPPSVTATATSTHTPTPSPTPTPTHTLTPTYTPTQKPTATSTITPTLAETAIMTPTTEITATDSITP